MADEQLQSKMDEILDRSELNGALIGVSIRTATEGELLYSHLGDTRLRPASNMKLLTAATALETLGEDNQFTTEILTDGMVEEQVL